MKAMRFHELGGPEVLRYEDVDQPTPAGGHVRIRVTATSFDHDPAPADWWPTATS